MLFSLQWWTGSRSARLSHLSCGLSRSLSLGRKCEADTATTLNFSVSAAFIIQLCAVLVLPNIFRPVRASAGRHSAEASIWTPTFAY